MTAAAASLESTHFAIQAKVKFAGLSQLSADNDCILTASFHGDWQLKAHIPKAPVNGERSSLGIFVYLPQNLKQNLGDITKIDVTLSLESITGEVHATRFFTWDMPGGTIAMGYGDIVDWNKFWRENVDQQTEGGFYTRVSITSFGTSDRPMVFEPNMLNTVSRLTDGEDVFDTKFLLFSRPQFLHHPRGAQDLLPVYASSTFLQSQSDYFQTSNTSPRFI